MIYIDIKDGRKFKLRQQILSWKLLIATKLFT